jgi:phytoene dehydrogenase-like protein
MYSEAAAGRLDDSVEPAVYITSASLKDRTSPNHAPPGHSTLELMTVAPSQHGFWGLESAAGTWVDNHYSKDERYRETKQELTERLIERALEIIPDLREHIVWQEAATPITQERYTRSTGGTSYGIELAVDQFGPRRPVPRTEIEGLYLTGASTRSGHGIVGSISGGVATASSVLRRNLLGEVRGGAVFGDPSKLTAGGPDWDPLMACRRHADKSVRAQQVRSERELELELEQVPA